LDFSSDFRLAEEEGAKALSLVLEDVVFYV